MNPFPSLLPQGDLDTLTHLAETAPTGAFVECGVYRGGGAMALYRIAVHQHRTLHLFDTFSGHPVVDDTLDHPPSHWTGRYAEAAETLPALRTALPYAQFHVGVFPGTLPLDLTNIAFVHADMDLYHPTKAICELLPQRMVPGGRILFDDAPYAGCPGVALAIAQTLPPNTLSTTPNGKTLYTHPETP